MENEADSNKIFNRITLLLSDRQMPVRNCQHMEMYTCSISTAFGCTTNPADYNWTKNHIYEGLGANLHPYGVTGEPKWVVSLNRSLRVRILHALTRACVPRRVARQA